MANIAAARIQREFKEVVKSEEVTFGSNTQKTYHFLVFQFEFPKGNNTDSMFPTLIAWKNMLDILGYVPFSNISSCLE